ncbi:glycosyltransferase family 29 protein [Kushneria konosiri]|uniref:glycosyltransferase family 29 protein n=1 Tax=Kushneria konosiri TaxID=698828 RepID=UPI001314C18E|nr:glycosyltransferase family 29 protein [Kushneria konosiri]
MFLVASSLYPIMDLSNFIKTKKFFGKGLTANSREISELLRFYSNKHDASKVKKIYNFSVLIYPYNKSLFFNKVLADESMGEKVTVKEAVEAALPKAASFTIDEYIKLARLLISINEFDYAEALVKDFQSSSYEDPRLYAVFYFFNVFKKQYTKDIFNGLSLKIRRRDMSFFSFLFETLFKQGFVLEAYRLKDEVSDVLISQKEKIKDIDICYQVLMAYLFSERFESAKEYVDVLTSQKSASSLKNHPFQQVEEYLYRLGFSEKKIFYPERPHEGCFEKKIRSKTIAIVGPAGIVENLHEEIDSYDTVIRTNAFNMSDFLDEKKSLGTKLDISYYTKHTFKHRFDEILSLRKKENFIPVYRNRQDYTSALNMGDGPGARWVRRSPWNFMPNFKNMHAVQRIVWDVLKFAPEKIKLFNVNFYVGDLYNESYKPRGISPDKNSLGIKHDPLQSFLFIKNLHNAGVVECDSRAENVLKMSREEYKDYIQNSFGNEWKAEKGNF